MLPQPISDQPVALAFPHRAGRYRPAETRISSHGRWSLYMYEGISDLGMGPYCLTFLLRAQVNQSSARGAGVSTPRGAVSNRFFRPRIGRAAEIRKDFRTEDGALSSPRALVSRGSPVGQPSPPSPRPELQPISDRANMVGVSTPHGAVSTGPYHPRLALALFSNLTQSAIGR